MWYTLFMSEECIYITVAVIAFIVTDYISGTIAASMVGDLSSKKMKEGLLKKFVYILILFTCYIIDFVSCKVDLGFTVSLYVVTGVGISLIEITSIFENCCLINPDIKHSNILNVINKSYKNSKENKDDENR